MKQDYRLRQEIESQPGLPDSRDICAATNDLCNIALDESRSCLHPLLQRAGLDRLEQRPEFLGAFRSALETGIAQTLAAWQPAVQAVFRYDEGGMGARENWDGSIHLLVKVHRLSDVMEVLCNALDRSLLRSLNRLGWQRFRNCPSILNVRQVTKNELRHGVGYAAMFFAVHSVPVRIWPHDNPVR